MKILALAAELMLKWKNNSISFLVPQSQTDLWYHLGRKMYVRTGCWEDATRSLNRYFQTENSAVKEISEKFKYQFCRKM